MHLESSPFGTTGGPANLWSINRLRPQLEGLQQIRTMAMPESSLADSVSTIRSSRQRRRSATAGIVGRRRNVRSSDHNIGR